MRLAHLSDTHLGHMRYNKVVPATGINQREQDVSDAFERAVDGILEAEPDLILHTGDLFDSPRPTNRALYHAVCQIRRLVERGIPLVLISGNHSTPRLRATGSVFALLNEFLPHVHAVYSSRYEKIVVNGVALHAVPHCTSQEALEAEIARVKPDPSARYNVALLHVGIRGFREFNYCMAEANEQILSEAQLPAEMDYVALGHYHKHVKVQEGVWYAGSTERFSFREANDTKGFCIVDLAERRPHFHEIPIRPMIDLDPIQARDMDALDLLDAIARRLRGHNLEGALVRLRIRDCPFATQRNLDLRTLREMTASALHFALHWEHEGERGEEIAAQEATFRSLEEEWQRFMQSAEVHGRDRAALLRAGMDYLVQAQSEEEPDAPDLAQR